MAKQPIILFDGMCNLCSNGVKFVMKRDPEANFLFCPIPSATADELLLKYGITQLDNDTFVLIKDHRCYFRSDAALLVLRELSGYWPIFTVFRIIPRQLRDLMYTLVAKNRYRFFGRRATCLLPSEEERKRLLY